jgi:hypothetical protein
VDASELRTLTSRVASESDFSAAETRLAEQNRLIERIVSRQNLNENMSEDPSGAEVVKADSGKRITTVSGVD